MRGCVRAFLFLLSFHLLTVSAESQCSGRVYTAPFRSSALDLAVDGDYIWVATGYGVELFDGSRNPPLTLSTVAIPGTTHLVEVSGTTAYVASGSRIHVVTRNGRALSLLGSVNVGSTINDLLLTPRDLYVATAAGVAQFDLLDATRPARTQTRFETSSAAAYSLTISGANLIVADGDSSVEVFNITVPSIPQKVSAIESLPRSIAVHAIGSRLYVSDGLETQILLSSGGTFTRAGTTPYGSVSFVTLADDVAFIAGTDRDLRALDFGLPGGVVRLFETALAGTGGNVHRVGGLHVANGRLYVAAGDNGLTSWDVSGFSPSPVRVYSSTPTTSVVSIDGRVFASRATKGLVEFMQNSTGRLTEGRQWDDRNAIVHDAATGFLLTSAGATLTYWTTASAIPVPVGTVTLSSTVSGAVLFGNTALALLADKTIWSIDMAAQTPTPGKLTTAGVAPSGIARAGSGVAFAETKDDGTTSIILFSDATLSGKPKSVSIPGVATSGIAAAGARVAAFTFRGINVVDFSTATPSVTVLPQSTARVPKKLGLTATTLLALSDEGLAAWDLGAPAKASRWYPVPGQSLSMHVRAGGSSAAIAMADGVATVDFTTSASLPSLIAAPNSNAFYRKIWTTTDRMYLFSARGVDVFDTTAGVAPHYVSSVRTPGLIDVTATDAAMYTLSSAGGVASFSADGQPLIQTQLNEGADAVPLAITTAGGAVWVSFSTGCLAGGCEKRTLVLDPRTLVKKATIPGGVIDVTQSGTRAYAIFDLPSEVRVYDLRNPLQPVALSSKATEGTQPAASVAFHKGVVYVLSDRLYSHRESDLNRIAAQLTPWAVNSSGLSYTDQRVRIAGNCAAITARGAEAQWYTIPATGEWQAGASFEAPSTVRSIATRGAAFYVMTDHSLEIAGGSFDTPPRRRGR